MPLKHNVLKLIFIGLALCPVNAAAAIRVLQPGDNFQAALDTAVPGDIIQLPAGSTFPGNFILPVKSGSSYITIRSSGWTLLPPDRRVTPADAPKMARLLSPNNEAVLTAKAGVHHYRFIGLELASKPGSYTQNIVRIGGPPFVTTLADMPRHFEFDRVYVHGAKDTGGKRGIQMGAADIAVKNSYLRDFKSVIQETQALSTSFGTGPFLIQNNHLEASGVNVMFGGATPAITGLVPSNIVIRGNHFYKPLTWKADHPSFAGTTWLVKNLLEFKSGRNILVEGNIFENSWPHGQHGFGLLLMPTVNAGSWAVVDNVIIRNNIIKNVAIAIDLVGNMPLRRIRIENNLMTEITRWLFLLSGGPIDTVTIVHNTGMQEHSPIQFGGDPKVNFRFLSNIVRAQYGVHGNSTGIGKAALDRYAPGYVFSRNVLIGGPESAYPAGNYFPASMAEVGFVNAAAGNYALGAGSIYRLAGTDGRDLGVDFAALAAATDSAQTRVAPVSIQVNAGVSP